MEHPLDPKDNGTRVPAATYGWMIPVITRIARRHGYAIGVHGSMSRDLDLIAVPWVDTANEPIELIDEICEAVGGVKHRLDDTGNIFEQKPHGRFACNIIFTKGHHHFLDISFMPRIPVAAT